LYAGNKSSGEIAAASPESKGLRTTWEGADNRDLLEENVARKREINRERDRKREICINMSHLIVFL
jgi:hypothetical protein